MNGKHYSNEYKEQIAKVIVEDRRKAAEVARDLEIPVSTLYKWISAYKNKLNPNADRVQFHSGAEFKKMENEYKKQLYEKQEELEILKKAMHIFAKSL